ncbi:MAG: hypothetical protein A3G93_02115 [Nitrospinae bacterium RIFCSPLOWO2_12_FULL_45_22]|nr:MAG: hypothetical protein A3G93_02115 [Nitrospinae bacterium RIFCSPLOWO2_12_FULL_45_22]
MLIINKQKLEDLLKDFNGASFTEKLRVYCDKQATGSPETSPNFDKVITSHSGLIAWVHGENPALAKQLEGLRWKPLEAKKT